MGVSREIAPKIRRIGYYVNMIHNRYTVVLFNLTATNTVNKRVLMPLKEIREFTKTLLDTIDELIKELEVVEELEEVER